MKTAFTWDASRVLNYIESMGDNDTLSFKDITLKVVTLLMILSASRVHCIQGFSIKAMQKNDNEITFYPTVLLKHSRPHFRGEPITYRAYPENDKLCVIKALSVYLERRSSLTDSDVLLITHRKPHRPAHHDTITRWLKTILKLAGIDTSVFTAHTFRSASTSYANTAKIPIKDILKQGQWTQESTWTKYYKKEIQYMGQGTKNYAYEILKEHTKK